VDDRPVLHCLVAFVSPAFGLCSEPRVMPLEDAADYARFGFSVIVDPQDQSDLQRWEQIQRSLVQQSRRRTWLQA
jgi:hypothetical protein